jgi:membrane-associated phospholipid phosphatase
LTIAHFLKTYGGVNFLVLAISLSAFAAENPTVPTSTTQAADTRTPSTELNSDYFAGYLTDTGRILTSPVRWDSSDWLKASVVTGVAVGLYTQDDRIQTWVQNHKTTATRNLADIANKTFILSFPALVGLGTYGYISSDEKARTTFLLSAESFIITGAFVQTLKFTTGRHRPSTGDSHATWSGFSTEEECHSFASGHASSAFALAAVVATEYDNTIVPSLAYGAATLIALERIHENAHWSSDVFVGSALGYFTGKAVVASHSQQSNLSFEPLLNGKDRGFLMSYKF